ncbi:MAG: hypothetical protein WC405_12015, partial [Syntrophales bacterium]
MAPNESLVRNQPYFVPLTQIGSFTKSDGMTSAAADVWFKTDKMHTIANEWLEIPADIATLPDLQSYGNVYDLHQAMVRDYERRIEALVESFIAETDPAVRTQLMDQIIFKWAGCNGVDPASRAVAGISWIDARQLVALKTFLGDGFVHVPDNTPNPYIWADDVLMDAYSMLSSLMYGQLMAQTHVKSYYEMISYSWDETTQTVKGDLTAVAQAIQTLTFPPETDPFSNGVLPDKGKPYKGGQRNEREEIFTGADYQDH